MCCCSAYKDARDKEAADNSALLGKTQEQLGFLRKGLDCSEIIQECDDLIEKKRVKSAVPLLRMLKEFKENADMLPKQLEKLQKTHEATVYLLWDVRSREKTNAEEMEKLKSKLGSLSNEHYRIASSYCN